MVWPANDAAMHFCGWSCIQTWLGPDRPLTRRLLWVKKGRVTPQPVVVGGPETTLRTAAAARELDKELHPRVFSR